MGINHDTYGTKYKFYRDHYYSDVPHTINSSLTVNGSVTGTSWNTSSDRRLKENITELSEDDSSNIIDNIKVYSFYFKNVNVNNDNDDKEEEQAPYPKRLHYGVIAQELQELKARLQLTLA